MKNPDGSIAEERRVDPERNRLPLEAHVARALDRFVPRDGSPAEAIATAPFREGDEMRRLVRALLFRLDSSVAPELAEFIAELSKQFEGQVETLKRFGFLDEQGKSREGDIALPAFERVLAAFSPDQLTLAKGFQDPTLLVMPDVSFADLVRAIDAHKTMPEQADAYVNQNIFGDTTGVSQKRIANYRPCIAEGTTKMPVKEGDDVHLALWQRVEAWKAKRRATPELKGMDRRKYAMLMAYSIHEKKPVDPYPKPSWTIFDDDEALSTGSVPRGYWGAARPNFRAGHPGYQYGFARFRSSVGGDVLIA